jgi:hypothetical protein
MTMFPREENRQLLNIIAESATVLVEPKRSSTLEANRQVQSMLFHKVKNRIFDGNNYFIKFFTWEGSYANYLKAEIGNFRNNYIRTEENFYVVHGWLVILHSEFDVCKEGEYVISNIMANYSHFTHKNCDGEDNLFRLVGIIKEGKIYQKITD